MFKKFFDFFIKEEYILCIKNGKKYVTNCHDCYNSYYIDGNNICCIEIEGFCFFKEHDNDHKYLKKFIATNCPSRDVNFFRNRYFLFRFLGRKKLVNHE